ncbi:MAG: polysaccharide deacetylase family protein [Patescibacteria group bacterium]
MPRTTIVMYHYVRDLAHSRYPEIKGLEVGLFKEQLRYIMKHYKPIRMEDLIDAIKNNKSPSDNSILLTFDDAYKDHFDFVFPVLDELGIQGSFFPPVKAIQEHQVLDVNKIHFILASFEDKKQMLDEIYSMLAKYREEYSLESDSYYEEKLRAEESRYDTREVFMIKKLLQRELPKKLRNIITDFLFNKYVTTDESAFSRELYMSLDQLKCLKRKGMYIGVHGYGHDWLNTLPQDQQKQEVRLSLEFLRQIKCETKDFVFCYPYGAYDDSLLSILKQEGCSLALTTKVGVADLDKDQPLALPRLNTNDLPKDASAEPNKWALEVNV